MASFALLFDPFPILKMPFVLNGVAWASGILKSTNFCLRKRKNYYISQLYF